MIMATIQEFYSERSVFLTGASGFLGKQVLEKLLRSCNVKNAYVLVRPKKGKSTQDRRDELIKSELFSHVRVLNPGFESRIVAVAGDMASPGMGLSEDDIQEMKKNVSVVIHSAASVNFTEKIRDAVTTNVIGLQQIMRFAKTLPKLESFVHISTAFVNCHQKHSPEIIVRPLQDPELIIELIKKETDEALEGMTPELIHPWPNTYTFTKSLAEWLLVQEMGDMPCCIFRPSIISASAEEPGWVDNFNGSTGLMTAAGSGLLSSVYGKRQLVADIVPVDLCANAIIALGWSTAIERPSKPAVYNFASGQLNPVTWVDFRHWVQFFYNLCPMNISVGKSHVVMGTNRLLHYLLVYGEDRVKFFFLDLIFRLKRQKPRMVRLHQKALKGAEVLEYFTTNEWVFETENIVTFMNSISSEDRMKFNFDIKGINWHSYLVNYCLGIKQYAMKESLDPTQIQKAKMIQNRMHLLKTGYRITVFAFILALIWRRINFNYLRTVVSFLLAVMQKIFGQKAVKPS